MLLLYVFHHISAQYVRYGKTEQYNIIYPCVYPLFFTYAGVVPQMSPPLYDIEQLRTIMVDFIFTSKEPVCPRVELILKIIIILLIIFLGFIKSKPC